MDAYATHLPILCAAVSLTKGAVLEMGTGWYSTPVLHALCGDSRRLVSVDTDAVWAERFAHLRTPSHQIITPASYDECHDLLLESWDVAFIDHAPALRRIVDIERVTHARYVVIHDAEECRDYGYSRIIPLFKYALVATRQTPWTAVLSNKPLDELMRHAGPLLSL